MGDEELTDEQVGQRATAALEAAKKAGVKVLYPAQVASREDLARDAWDTVCGLIERSAYGAFRTVRSISTADVMRLGGVPEEDEWLYVLGDAIGEDTLAVYEAPADYSGETEAVLVFFDHDNPYPGRKPGVSSQEIERTLTDEEKAAITKDFTAWSEEGSEPGNVAPYEVTVYIDYALDVKFEGREDLVREFLDGGDEEDPDDDRA